MDTTNGEEEKVPFIDAEETDPPAYSEQSYPREQFIIRPVPFTDGPKDYLVEAILVTLFCCWPIGICAILKAMEVQRASRAGDRLLAQELSNTARKMVRITLVIGIITNIVILMLNIGFMFSHAETLDGNKWNQRNPEARVGQHFYKT